jgi:carboxypeptidase T
MDMSRIIVRLVTSAVMLCSSAAGFGHIGSHASDGPKQIYRFKLNDYRSQMSIINSYGFDVAGVDLRSNVVDLVLDTRQLTSARDFAGLKLVEMVNDGSTDLDEQYQSPGEIELALEGFASRYPELASIKSIGKSHQGRDIWAIKISDNVAESEREEPAILFNSMHHAREVMTPEVALDTINFLLTRYTDDANVRRWVNNNEIWVVPMLNVDGNNKVWDGSTMWRKNAREDHGVDINRNYPYAWNTCNGSSGYKFSDTYRGPSAGSEPEVQALMGLVAEIRPVFDISYHSYSELVIYPYGCEGVRTTTQEVVENIGNTMASLLPSDSGKGNYSPGTAWELLYSVDGGDIDWMYNAYGVIPYVIEVNSTREGFQPSYSQWREKTVAKMRPAWQLLLNRVEQSGIRGYVEFSSGKLADRVNAKIESINNPSLSARNAKIKADGSFHVVLTPGTYSVTISDGQTTLPPETVTVGDRLTSVEFDF